MCRSGGGGGASEKGLTTGFRGINAICDRLALVKIIRDRACEVFKKVRRRSAASDAAASLYAAGHCSSPGSCAVPLAPCSMRNRRRSVMTIPGRGRPCRAVGRFIRADRPPLWCYQALESGGVKGRQAVAMHAACVYMACRLEHNPRTFKEILAGAPGTSKVHTARQC